MLCGLGEKGGNFLWYAITQVAVLGIASYSLKDDQEENLPGVNIDPEGSPLSNIAKGLGYTFVEQTTFALSQGVRFYIDFNEEFGGGKNWHKKDKDGSKRKEVMAKVMANLVNERLLPGHILLGLSSAISTYLLGSIIPKTTAAAIGEFPMSILNRMLNCRQRRATKYVMEEKYDDKGKLIEQKHKLDKKGNKIWNYRFNPSKTFNTILDMFDAGTRGVKELSLDLITNMFRGETDAKRFKKKLKDSFDMQLNMAA